MVLVRSLCALVAVALVGLAVPGSTEARSRAGLERRAVPTVIRDVMVFESEAGATAGPHDVWLRDGRVESLTAPGEVPPSKGVREVDGAGRTLIPGLVESHAHVLGDGDFIPRVRIPDTELSLTAAIAAGVTTVVDVGDWERPLLVLQRRIARGAPGPTLYHVGRVITAVGGHPAAILKTMAPPSLHAFIDRNLVTQVASPGEAAAVVAQRASIGARALKVALDDLPTGVPQMGDEILVALVREAHAAGLEVWAHVGEPEDVTQALAAGVDALVHIPNRGVLRDEDVAELAARDIPVMSTLHVFRRIDELNRRAVVLSELERALAHPRPIREYDEKLSGYEVPESMQTYVRESGAGQAAMLESIRKLKAAGVRILAGSDTANAGSFLGPGLHHELDLLVEAGLTPSEALTAATWTAGTWLDPDANFGAVREGWQADLVLVAGDPTVDLAPVHRPLAVWVDGRLVRPRAGTWDRVEVR